MSNTATELFLDQFGLDAFPPPQPIVGVTAAAPFPSAIGGPGEQILIALNNGPNDDPALITQVAAPGVLGPKNTWTDISQYVYGRRMSRGRQHELSQFEAGTLELDLNNQDGRFYPWNTAGPYYGLLTPRKPVQVRYSWNGQTYKWFTGQVDAWPSIWNDPISSFGQMHATDAFRMFTLADITTTGYQTQILADGPSAYFRMAEPVGSTHLTDSTGNNNTLIGEVVPIPNPMSVATWLGQTGLLPANAASSLLLAQNDAVGYPTMSTGAPYVTGTAATMEFWTSSPSGTGVVWSTMTWNQSGTMYGAGIQFGNTTINSILNGLIGTYSAAATLQDGNSHHVVIVADTVAGTYIVYVDGVALISQTGITYSAGPWSTGNFTYLWNQLNTGSTFVQELAFYPFALTATQVSNHFNLGTFPQQRTDQRIAAVLNAVGWSAGARNLDSNTTSMQKVTSSLVTTSTLQHMQDCEATEGGALYMDTAGRVRFISRQTLASDGRYQVSSCTFGDNRAGGDIPFEPSPTLALDDIDLYNEARGQRNGGLVQVAQNATSIAAYGRNTWQPAGSLLGLTDSEVLGMTQYVVNNHSTPVPRVQSIDINVLALINAPANQLAAVFALELLYRVTVERLGIPGSAFSQVSLVEHITERRTPDEWVITLGMDVADTTAYWTLGVSQLGVNNALYW